jgi:phosphate/sulfate permease
VRPLRVLVVATLVASAVAAAPSWAARPPKPVTEAAVRACVAQNLVRYSDPQHAAVLQYVDIAAACRAALAGGGSDVQVQIVPIGSRSSRIAKTPAGAPAAAYGAVSSPNTAESKAVTRTPHGSKAGAMAQRLRRPPEVAGLLPDGSSPRAPAPGLIDSAPWWALALVGAICFGTGARALLGARRRPR